jgi:Zn-dependent peptidase ImmA (M78 family)
MAKEKYDYKKNNILKDEIADYTTARMKEIAENLNNPDGKAIESLKEYFKQFSNFYNYSAKNIVVLINQAQQRGMILSKVQSFKDWGDLKNEQGENVRINKGETGLKVFVPQEVISYKRDDKGEFLLDNNNKRIPELKEDGTVKKKLYFGLGTVFDLAQTNAIEIGAIKKSHLFLNAKENSLNIDEDFVKDLIKEVEEKYKLPIKIEKIESLASGYNQKSADSSIIVIDETLPPEQKLSVVFHELGHHIMHPYGNDFTKEQKEAEAESFAYILSSKFGVDNNSSQYIKGYVKDENELMALLTNIQKAVNHAHKNLSLDEMLDKAINIAAQKELNQIEDKKDIFDEKNNAKVTILWSENKGFKEGEVLTLKEADDKFAKLDSEFPSDELGYDKTKFLIEYKIDGEEHSYEGRYDIGDKENGLLNHIRNEAKNSDDLPYKDIIEENNKIINEVVLPFFEKMIELEINQNKIEEIEKKVKKQESIISMQDTRDFKDSKIINIPDNEAQALFNKTNDELHITDPINILNDLGIDYKIKRNGTQYEFAIRNEDNTASANLYIAKDGNWRFYDFGTGESGTIENVIMKLDNKDYKEAREYAISKLGVNDYFAQELALKRALDYTPKEINLSDEARTKIEELKESNKDKASQFNNNTRIISIKEIDESNTQAMEYLKSRGITKIPNFMYEAEGEIFGSKNGRSYNIKNIGLGVATTNIEPLENEKLGVDIHYYNPVELKNGTNLKTGTYGANGISPFINGTGEKLIIAESKWDMAAANEKNLLTNATCIIANSTSNFKLIDEYIKDKQFTNTLILNQNDKPGDDFKDKIIHSENLQTKAIYVIKYNDDEVKQDVNDLLKNGVELRTRVTKVTNIDEFSNKYGLDETQKAALNEIVAKPGNALNDIKAEMQNKPQAQNKKDLEQELHQDKNIIKRNK